MLPFRVTVIDGNQTAAFVVPLKRAPDAGEVIELPHGERATVRHVISAERDGLEGIVLVGLAPRIRPGLALLRDDYTRKPSLP